MITYAFVLKNFVPVYKKVQILHAQYGKITCVYSKDHHASRLTTGSLILCDVVAFGRNLYSFEYLDIVQNVQARDLEQLQFVHEMMLICFKSLPGAVAVEDVMHFLQEVYLQLPHLTEAGRKVAMLRLFLLTGVLPEHPELYRAAMHDLSSPSVDHSQLQKYIAIGWDYFHQNHEQM